jgi:hypothetical protein
MINRSLTVDLRGYFRRVIVNDKSNGQKGSVDGVYEVAYSGYGNREL